MRSLRSRLILGSALIAVVPLAIVTFMLSRRIEDIVRRQADERMNAALTGLRARVEADGMRIAGKLEILARDPQLKRLYLVRTSTRDLSDYLSQRRFLLDLDFLQVVDTTRVVVGDASSDTAGEVQLSDSTALAVHGRAYGVATIDRDGVLGLALIASSAIPYENEIAGVVRGGEFFDASFLTRLKQSSGVDLILHDASGRIVAATLGEQSGGYLSRTVPLEGSARITGLISTAPFVRTVRALQIAALALALGGLAIAILLGVFWSSQISSPVERLAAFSRRLAQGEWDEPLELRSVRELETLVAALDQMRSDLRSYRTRLITSERHAAWSQMARKVAHEVKNPLTPIAISIADLERSYAAKREDFPQILEQAVRTIGEEIESLKRLLQEFSDFARLPAPNLAPCRVNALLDDLSALYTRDVADGRLSFARPERDVEISADAAQLRQALVNLIKNALEATASGGRVTVSASEKHGALEIAVADTGPGLGAAQRANLFVPGFTTKAEGSGLGLTIVERNVNDHRGTIAVDEGSDAGTTLRIRLPLQATPDDAKARA
ncbi:MAG TPA: ATP-binding protein [Candidatus Udaeobacter sp.]|nr:ATP-binding protein [Candidatus Udaeobacter sp.]